MLPQLNPHTQHERRALCVKIDKLHKWLQMYWDGKLKRYKPQDALEIRLMIVKAETELKSL